MLVVALRLAFGSVSFASAASANCGSFAYSFKGASYNPSPAQFRVRGAESAIEIRPADLCPENQDDSNDVTAWAMIAADSGPGHAQIGYVHKWSGDTAWRFFWEYQKDSGTGSKKAFFGDPTWGDRPNFKVARGNDGSIRMYFRGDLAPCNGDGVCPVTPWDPLTAWSGIHAEWHGESKRPGSDMPGSSGDRAEFAGIQVKDSDDQWYSRSYSPTGTPCDHYHRNVVDPQTKFEIWTNPIAHDASC